MTRFGKTISVILVIILLALIGLVWWLWVMPKIPSSVPQSEGTIAVSEEVTTGSDNGGEENAGEPIEVIATNLEIPWDIVFLPNGEMLVTQRVGTVKNITTGAEIDIEGVHHSGEGGLLGMVLHPDFRENNFIYLYHTIKTDSGMENQVVRYVYENGTLTEEKEILGGVPSAIYHDGGRMEFGPDAKLWVTIGDATSPDEAQNPENKLGTLLRLNDDGTYPADNPLPNGVYSYGHRNAQGLAWDEDGNLWSTEHGRSGLKSGLDEVNLIVPGGNYGWPDIEGDETAEGMIAPAAHSGSDITWAPASAAYWDGSIFFGGLRGEALYEAVLDGTDVTEVKAHFKGEYGRIRTVRLGPDGYMYVTTSNRDGRGDPHSNDDRIIKINPRIFRE